MLNITATLNNDFTANQWAADFRAISLRNLKDDAELHKMCVILTETVQNIQVIILFLLIINKLN